MRRHTLTRFDANTHGTLGRLEQWRTLEEEDQGNVRNISSIPVGVYLCRRHQSPTFGETFLVTGVPGRSAILFHWGNTEENTQGCILVGKHFSVLRILDEDTGEYTHKLATMQSRDAFDEFMKFFEGVDEWLLEIKDY